MVVFTRTGGTLDHYERFSGSDGSCGPRLLRIQRVPPREARHIRHGARAGARARGEQVAQARLDCDDA